MRASGKTIIRKQTKGGGGSSQDSHKISNLLLRKELAVFNSRVSETHTYLLNLKWYGHEKEISSNVSYVYRKCHPVKSQSLFSHILKTTHQYQPDF